MGLGEKAIEEIAKHYPNAIGMELYTRKTNYSAQLFYKHCGFRAFTKFDFKEPMLRLNKPLRLHFPDDDSTNHPEAFIAFSKTTSLIERNINYSIEINKTNYFSKIRSIWGAIKTAVF